MSIESSDVCDTIVAWARGIPAIRRGWLIGDAGNHDPADEINVAIELEPVGDSEETLVLWLSHADRWRAQLREHTGAPANLDWFDLDAGASNTRGVLEEAMILVYERSDPA